MQPHMEKHGLKLFTAMSNEDQARAYNPGEAETMEEVEAFVIDTKVMQMRREAGVIMESHEVITAISEYHIF